MKELDREDFLNSHERNNHNNNANKKTSCIMANKTKNVNYVMLKYKTRDSNQSREGQIKHHRCSKGSQKLIVKLSKRQSRVHDRCPKRINSIVRFASHLQSM